MFGDFLEEQAGHKYSRVLHVVLSLDKFVFSSPRLPHFFTPVINNTSVSMLKSLWCHH